MNASVSVSRERACSIWDSHDLTGCGKKSRPRGDLTPPVLVILAVARRFGRRHCSGDSF
jgi:hypothetical protein